MEEMIGKGRRVLALCRAPLPHSQLLWLVHRPSSNYLTLRRQKSFVRSDQEDKPRTNLKNGPRPRPYCPSVHRLQNRHGAEEKKAAIPDSRMNLSKIFENTWHGARAWAAAKLVSVLNVQRYKLDQKAHRPRGEMSLNTARRLPPPDWTARPPQWGISLDKLRNKHKNLTKQWRGSAEYRELVVFLKSILDDGSLHITTCLCLCLGTLSGPSWTSRYDSCSAAMSQLVALESMVEILRRFTPLEGGKTKAGLTAKPRKVQNVR